MNIYLEKRKQLPKVVLDYLDSPQAYIDDESVFLAFELKPDQIPGVAKIIGQVFAGLKPIEELLPLLTQTLKDQALAAGVAGATLRKSFLRFPQLFPKALELESLWSATGTKPKIPLEEAEKQFVAKNPWVFVKEEPEEIQPKKIIQPIKTVKLALLKALTEYPQLGNQLVTADKIKLKGQTEVQRPSLTNWIHYYRDQLGVGFHDEVARGHFLFQSENGKRLSAEDREHVSLILKSIEEDIPLDIDTEHGVIIFSTRSAATPVVKSAFIPSRSAGIPARPIKPYQPVSAPVASVPKVEKAAASPLSFFSSKLGAAKNVAGDTLEFSTGHVLPSEKPMTPPTISQKIPNAPLTAFGQAGINRSTDKTLPRGPYSIRPLRMRNDEPKES